MSGITIEGFDSGGKRRRIELVQIGTTGRYGLPSVPVDSTNIEVNPATEGKQDDIITALGLVAPAGSITSGRKTITTANTPEQITATSTPIKSVTIQALPGNVGSIAIGSSNAVRASAAANMNGIILEAGDAYPVYVDNLNKVWIDASVNGEGVTYMYNV